MAKITRKKGKTTIEWQNLTLTTNKINRHQYNQLRKKTNIKIDEIKQIIKRKI
jgi:uncharacterized protein YdbL (DUF1318 family)